MPRPYLPRTTTFEGAHGGWVSDLQWVKGMQGGSLVSGSLDTTIKLFDHERALCKRTLKGHTKGILSLAAVDSRQLLVSGGLDRRR